MFQDHTSSKSFKMTILISSGGNHPLTHCSVTVYPTPGSSSVLDQSGITTLFHDYKIIKLCLVTISRRRTLAGFLFLNNCYVPFWNTCHPETYFRLAWCAGPKNVNFWNRFQISTVQTSSYRSRMINAHSCSIKISGKRPKVRPGCICLFVWLVVFQ